MITIKELLDLKGRTALITGASGGLGKVIAVTLAELGADLILVDYESSSLINLANHCAESWGISATSIACNLELQDQRAELIEMLKNNGQTLNILVNNAAFVGASDLDGWAVPFEHQSIETWRRAIEVNLTAIFHLSQGLYPLLKVARGANIVNIASIYGSFAPDWALYEGTEMGNPAAYSASKGGLIQLTRWLATTIAPEVRVNAISPGGIYRSQPEIFVDRYKCKTPLKRMANENDFKGAVAYLSSDMARYVTGQNLLVDGGWGV